MSIHLQSNALINAQQMEVAVNGPDGATYLILCTGVADLGFVSHESFTFFVGPQLSRRQFVGAIVSGAIATIQTFKRDPVETKLILINANYDDESGRVTISAEVSSTEITNLAISYNVSILAEMPII